MSEDQPPGYPRDVVTVTAPVTKKLHLLGTFWMGPCRGEYRRTFCQWGVAGPSSPGLPEEEAAKFCKKCFRGKKL